MARCVYGRARTSIIGRAGPRCPGMLGGMWKEVVGGSCRCQDAGVGRVQLQEQERVVICESVVCVLMCGVWSSRDVGRC